MFETVSSTPWLDVCNTILNGYVYMYVCNPHISVNNTHNFYVPKSTYIVHISISIHFQDLSPPPPRVLFGSSHLYVFHHPKELAQLAKEGRAPKPVTYDFAQEEIAQEKGFDMSIKGKNIGVYVCLLLLE